MILKIRNIKFKKYSKYWNAFLALAKVIIGILSNSVFVFMNAFYNIGIFVAKKLSYNISKEINEENENKKGNYYKIAIIMIVSSLFYILYTIRMFVSKENVDYGQIVAITIATVSFTELTIAITGVVKAHKKKDINTVFDKLINLSTAFICMVFTQSAILSFAHEGDASIYNGYSGLFFGSLNMIIGTYMIIYTKRYKMK